MGFKHQLRNQFIVKFLIYYFPSYFTILPYVYTTATKEIDPKVGVAKMDNQLHRLMREFGRKLDSAVHGSIMNITHVDMVEILQIFRKTVYCDS